MVNKNSRRDILKKPADVEESDFKHLVRVSGVVLDGNMDVSRVLTKIKGIGQHTAKSLIMTLNIQKDTKLGNLNEKEIERIEDGIKNLDKSMPGYMTNMQKELETGKNIHLTGPELDMANRANITRHKKIKSYRGIRHIQGLPVRGQRTRTSFRKGTTMGVSRKKTTRTKERK